MTPADLSLAWTIGAAAVSVAFSAGMAFMSIRLLGQKIDSLKEYLHEVKHDADATADIVAGHHTDLAVLKTKLGLSPTPFKSPRTPNGRDQ